MISFGRYPWRESLQGLSDRDYEVIYQVMHETDTLRHRDKPITQLSGGEKQRVILAAALAQEPKILLIDEGFSALDIKHKSDLIHVLKGRIEREGLRVVAIIHDLNIAYQISDAIIIMKEGKVVVSGSREQVMTKSNIEDVYETKVNVDPNFGFSMQVHLS
jgi:iron complex transport system ATP-binding protein